MKEILHRSDELTRRSFMSKTASSLLGVGLMPGIVGGEAFAQAAATAAKSRPTARNVIYLYMSGGMTHLDTFDPKPGSETQGPVEAIRTKADDVMISEYLPGLASQMDKVALVRSMTTTQGAHAQGNYFMHSSYVMRGTIRHPGMGAWLQKLDGRPNRTLPGSVKVGGGGMGGAGFMGQKFGPLVLNNPNEGLRNSKRRDGISEKDFNDRLMLADMFDKKFHSTYKHDSVKAQREMYDDAVRLMKSEDLQAFDLSKESEATRENYGNNGFGQGVLLARRLIENDVRFVEVSLGGWDTHANNFASVSQRAAVLDQALTSLLVDLTRRGMLDETLVVVATEFGRTPRINENNGRDHFPKAFSCMLAGGGIKGGQAYGVTDERGENVIENKVQVPDFNATIAKALGLPLDKVVLSPSKRPFTVAHKGRPILDLFA
ncbi:MAG: hypothetical protein ACI8XO_002839 [Verrucomicrobiales bacterium]|jgi:hypothetical protein